MGGAAFWVILVGLVLATLPLLGDRSLFAVPLLKKPKQRGCEYLSLWWRMGCGLHLGDCWRGKSGR